MGLSVGCLYASSADIAPQDYRPKPPHAANQPRMLPLRLEGHFQEVLMRTGTHPPRCDLQNTSIDRIALVRVYQLDLWRAIEIAQHIVVVSG